MTFCRPSTVCIYINLRCTCFQSYYVIRLNIRTPKVRLRKYDVHTYRAWHGQYIVEQPQNVRLCVFTTSALIVTNVVYSQLRIFNYSQLSSSFLSTVVFALLVDILTSASENLYFTFEIWVFLYKGKLQIKCFRDNIRTYRLMQYLRVNNVICPML